ncbi:hypothetical protein G9F32_06400 [Acinetobacter sp. 194]|uniref:putative phage abortive infection protein n=1 Tax=Acinetobacter shaoyimingii TaxID=2715164 RepID=UPI00140D433C|nr:putative phage abortive infection protein [Acinetobacter shaoyimingii]NHB57664.1 hypothetical protein [Acinetobacter shaoyimingii]
MIKNTLLDRKIFWAILLILCTSIFIYIYAQHYLETKKLLEVVIDNKNELNNSSIDYSAIWGAFGDYVGGSLNPIIGLISVFLLFVTWRTTVQTLQQTQQELKESRDIQKEMQETQLFQQFDSFFFPFLEQLKSQEQLLMVIQQGKAKSELDSLYEKIFADVDYQSEHPKFLLEKSHLFNTYYFCLLEIIKNVDKNFINDKETANKYINIIKATMPFKLQQLLSLYLCENSEDLSIFVEYSIFENTPVTIIDTEFLSTVMIAIVQGYNKDAGGRVRNAIGIFGNSKAIRSLKNNSIFFADFLQKPAEMVINGSGVFDFFVLDFKKINITFDLGKNREFWCIERYYQYLLKIEKRIGHDFESSVKKSEGTIFFNKINVSYDYFEINVFNEKIKIEKKRNYDHESDFEMIISKIDEEEDEYYASSFEVVDKS